MNWKTNCSSCNAMGFPGAPDQPSFKLEKQKETKHRQKACSKTRGNILKKCCSQGKGLTVTSACDLGETCHLGLFLLHAVTAQEMALPQQAHACTKFHHCFQHNQRQLNLSACVAPRRVIDSRVRKHLPTAASRLVPTHILSPSARQALLSDFCGRLYFSIDKHPLTCFRMALQWFWSEVLCSCITRNLQS